MKEDQKLSDPEELNMEAAKQSRLKKVCEASFSQG